MLDNFAFDNGKRVILIDFNKVNYYFSYSLTLNAEPEIDKKEPIKKKSSLVKRKIKNGVIRSKRFFVNLIEKSTRRTKAHKKWKKIIRQDQDEDEIAYYPSNFFQKYFRINNLLYSFDKQ